MKQDNQRVIKFRAWDNGMFNDVIVVDDSWTDDIISDSWHCGNIMQYTGLKDKNGKEIYEGDILKTETEKQMVVGWSEKFASFVLMRDGWAFQHWFGEAADHGKCEVIGNIYENINLLNK